ncbi:MAG: DUF3015 family protein [Pseudohongiellaceae bacterium]
MNRTTSLLTAMTLAAGLATTTSVQAQSQNINPWQHCGIGAAIFDDNETAAALSNVIWDLGTTAVTSATMTPSTCAGEEVQVAEFIDQTYDVLAMETANGYGEHLSVALDLVGCSISENDQAVTELRSGLSDVISSSGYTSMTHADKGYAYYQHLTQIGASCSDS